MTAAEIRQHVDFLRKAHETRECDLNAAQVGALWEIAGQLAELKELLTPGNLPIGVHVTSDK